jgi:TonB-dependent receptor
MKFTKLYFFLFLIAFIPSTAWSQNEKGKISGKIIDKASGEELIGAVIRIEGGTGGSTTDIEGKYLMAIAPGKYTVVFSYISYQTQKIEAEVKANEVTFVDVVMEEAGNSLAEVVVAYTIQKSSSLSLLTERRNAAVVSDGISAESIRRTPDRTTSDVLKRITGASIQEGKFAIIRGMNDRYNAGYLDGALLPSTEADRKAFAFDVVPANLIDNLQIIKAGSPDLVGDFGGGIIKINTKSVPEELTQTITLGAQTHSLTTFKGFQEFKKYSGEGFNLLSSKRNMPELSADALRSNALFPNAEEKARLAENSKAFNNDWSNENVKATPNARFAYSLGFPIQLQNDNKLGVILALNYANTRRYSEGKINTFDGSGQVAKFSDQIFLQNISSGGIFNVNFVGRNTQISLRNLLNMNTDNNTVLRTGTGNIGDATEVQNTANLVNYNRLYNGIVSLKQIIGDNLFTLNASVNYANIRRDVPDYRIVNYTKTPDDEQYRLALGDFFNTSTGRFASNLNERLAGGTLELAKQFDGKLVKTEVKAGFFLQDRNRSFSSRSFVYNGSQPRLTYNPADDLSAENINASHLYLVEKTSDDIAYYNGKQNLTAYYACIDQKFFEKLRAVYGVRYEDADIHVFNEKVNSEVARIQEGAVLPSANLSYPISAKMNVRAAYYATVNRPEFRELAPFAFYVFDKNAEIRGNKDLQIARLNNYELRWELFPSGSQVLSVGGFYKTIKNPVEFSIDITQPFTTFTYQNEKSAKIYGLEFEARKNFDFLGERQVWHDLVVFTNLALIKSKLAFDEGSQSKANRPLQGQSPYVLNAGIQFDNEEFGWSASLVANRIGRRIAYVGVDPKFGDTRQDIFEAPRTVVDFQVGKTIGKLNLKFTIGDLLRHDLVYYQDANANGKYNAEGGDRLMFKFKNGTSMSLSAGYNF